MYRTTLKRLGYISFLLALVVLTSVQCRKDSLITDSNAELTFSTDTVMFDTVFTTVGSTTKNFLIYNPHKQKINISRLWIPSGSNSFFRLNVDGVPGYSHENIEIPAEDSLWVFAEVTLDPNGVNNPLVITDSIMFETNGNLQNVKLVAWGQDAYFHYNEILPCGEIWNNDKPHVIYGYAAVDSACSLTINPGTQVHLHNNSTLLVYKGRLDVNGTAADKVVFQGDRLEWDYQEIPGQWRKIHLFFAQDSEMDHAVIMNGSIGLQMDTLAEDGSGSNGLSITNTVIQNMSAAGLFSQGGKMTGENILIRNCGQFCGAFTIGGSYNFRHCTFANYWSSGNRQDPLFFLSNWYEDVYGVNQIRPLTNTRFDNCIFYGPNDEEFVIDMKDEAAQDYLFNHCLVKTEADLSDGNRYITIWKNTDPGFESTSNNEFRLLGNAFARDKGDVNYNTFNGLDFYGDPRNDFMPDPGYHEFQ